MHYLLRIMKWQPNLEIKYLRLNLKMNKLDFTMIFRFSESERQELSSQNISVEDYDFAIITDHSILESFTHEYHDRIWTWLPHISDLNKTNEFYGNFNMGEYKSTSLSRKSWKIKDEYEFKYQLDRIIENHSSVDQNN